MDVSLLVTLLQQKVKDYFKPKYEVNDCGVVTNPEIAFSFKHKSNKGVIPNLEIRVAETNAGKWVYAYSLHFSHEGHGYAVNVYHIDYAKSSRDYAIYSAVSNVVQYLNERGKENKADALSLLSELKYFLGEN